MQVPEEVTRRESDGAGIEEIVRPTLWVLGTQLRVSVREISALNLTTTIFSIVHCVVGNNISVYLLDLQ